MMLRSLTLALAGTLLIGMLACGGGSGGSAPAAASKLVYSDPPASGFRFVRNPTLSTDTQLVLDLLGPSDVLGRGVAFTLNYAGGPVVWSKVAPADNNYMQNLLFDLGTGVQIIETQVNNATLLAGAFQKGHGNEKPFSVPLVRVSLTAVPPLTTTTIPLQVVKFQYLPATGGQLTDATCAVGSLAVQ